MTTAVCVWVLWVSECVCGGRGGSVHSDEAHSQCLLFTAGPFTGPGLPPAPPSQFSSIPHRIPPSGASGMGQEGEGGGGMEQRGEEGRLSTANVFFRNRLLLVWHPMKTTPAFAVWTNCPVLSGGAEVRSKGGAAESGYRQTSTAERGVCVTLMLTFMYSSHH